MQLIKNKEEFEKYSEEWLRNNSVMVFDTFSDQQEFTPDWEPESYPFIISYNHQYYDFVSLVYVECFTLIYKSDFGLDAKVINIVKNIGDITM